jgi:hypothetical protein
LYPAPPVASLSTGVPVTVTFSENETCILITPPLLYEPSVVDDVTFVTVGAVVSMMIALLKFSDPDAPGVASVSVASFVARSRIVPPFSVRALVEVYARSLDVSPAATVY